MSEDALFITKEYAKRWCGSKTIYERGLSYYQQGRVIKLDYDPNDHAWYATVAGSDEYNVVVYIMDGCIDASCDCPAYETHWACKHIVAVLLGIEQRQRYETGRANAIKLASRQGVDTSDPHIYRQADQIIRTFMNRFNPEIEVKERQDKEPLKVEYHLSKNYVPYSQLSPKFLSIELKVGTKRTYVVKKIGKFLQSVEEKTTCFFTSKFAYDPSDHYFLEEDQEVLKLLREIQRNEGFFRKQRSYYYGSHEDERSLLIPPMIADELLSKLQGRTVVYENHDNVRFQTEPQEHNFPLLFRLMKGTGDDFQLDLTSLKGITFFEDYGWLFQEGTFYKLPAAQKDIMIKLAPFMNPAGERFLPVARKQMETFVSYVIPRLKEIGRVELAEQVSDQIVSLPLNAKVYIDRTDERLFVKIEYHYGNIVIDPFRPEAANESKQGMILLREPEKEQAIMKVFESIPFKYNGKECYLEGDDQIYNFLFTVVPKLEQKAEIYMTNAVRALISVKQNTPVTKIDVNTGGNLLEISFGIEGIDEREVKKILQSVVEKKKYYRLPDGAFVSLENEAFQTMNRLFTELHINKSQVKAGVLQLPVYRGLQIDEIVGERDRYSVKLGKKFRRLIQDLKNPDTIDFVVPETLHAKLRDYQQFGFQWLKTMAHYRLGGILADDMGLGKTLQTIAYLLSEKADENRKVRTSLIVVPASLVYNWKSEFERYAPDVDVVVAYGTPDERLECLRSCNPDVFITSYPLLRQDIEVYQDMEFDSLILDEAQAIKNHSTKTADAVKKIKATKRFALSGTPIENSLDELWSIFDAILPGFFQNQSSFRSLSQDKIARMVRPFILRRVKQDVLKELPDKIETVHQSDLTKEQKELYIGYLEKIQRETKESLQTVGFEKSRIKILAGLTRLRQLCCHPSLFLENYDGKSGKLEQLTEIIEHALQNKRRLLVFSQFTSMLQIIREELDRRNIGYFYLDGQTPSKDRVEMTERFNHGEKDLFLISLKAGGTGLNVTGADTVILYDLWWNPAVEEQAAGRAHRIGQKNSVHVMKLIARGTIEEKIYELQQKKKELIEQVIQSGETTLSSLSEAEIREILGI
jgi:superfamily II DNA or RNA helicase